MSISITFVTFSTLFIVTSSNYTHSVPNLSIADQNLPKSICKITNAIISSTTDTQDILVGNIGGKVLPLTFNDILECIEDVSAVVVSNFEEIIVNKHLRKATIVIMLINESNLVSMEQL